MEKFLIIRFSSIGDIILCSPLIRHLKLKYREAQIDFVTKKQYRFTLEHHPYIDKLHLLEENNFDQLKDIIKAQEYTAIFDLHHNLRSKKLTLGHSSKVNRFNKLNIEKWLFTNFKINYLSKQHIVDRYLATASLEANDNKGLDYYHGVNIKKLLNAYKLDTQPYIIGVIGGSRSTKQLPNWQWVKIASILESEKIVLLGDKQDNIIAQNIKSKNILNLCGKLSFNESAALCQEAKAVLTNDTGLMHVAAAYNKPIVSFWGNTSPLFGMYPYNVDQSLLIENNELSCRPCSKIGYNKCPKGHFKCMSELNLEPLRDFIDNCV